MCPDTERTDRPRPARTTRKTTEMTEQDQQSPQRPAHEDARREPLRRRRDAAQVARGVGRAEPVRGGRRRRPRAPLRADDVPLPERRPAHGSRRGDGAARRDRALLVAARLRRAEPDRLGLLRAARRERRDPPRRAPGDVHLRQHRDAGRVVRAATASPSTGRAGCTPATRSTTGGRSGCSCASASAAWPTASSRRSTGARTTRPCWPTSRSCRACASAAAPRSPSASCRSGTSRSPTTPSGCWTTWRRWRAPGPSACWPCSATGSAGPRARTSTSTSHRRRRHEHRHGLHHPPRHAVRRHVHGGRRRREAGRRGRRARAARGPGGATWSDVRKETDIDRLSTERPKTGVFLGVTATNPVNGERMPVWAADYVLADYGTGAIMAVPAHDQRDLDFAQAFGLPVRRVVDTGEDNPEETCVATTGRRQLRQLRPAGRPERQGRPASPGSSSSWRPTAGRPARSTSGCATGCCRGSGSGAARSRSCTARRAARSPVPDDQLPVVLPDLRGADLKPKGISPLAAAEDWVNVDCPSCGGPAKRDTDTMDTFVDSSWYFLRYCSPHYEDGPFDVEAVRRWMPAEQYVGGVEHAILHLLYSRFFTKVLHDMGMLDFVEPFTALLNQGQVINQGKAMSKSLGNGVDLGEMIDLYGVDAVRLTMVFAGPPEDDIDWADLSPAGSLKFLQRAWRLSGDVTSAPGTSPDGGDAGAAQGHPQDRARGRAADRVAPVQRRGGAGDGAGQRDPQGDRLRVRARRPRRARGDRDRRDRAEPGRAVPGRGDVGAAGSPADRRPRRLARRRPGAAGRGRGHRGRPGAGQAARQAGGQPRRSPRPTWRRPRWPTPTCSGRWTAGRCAR